VLIDADNARPGIKSLLGEVAKFGVASVKRIYGGRSLGIVCLARCPWEWGTSISLFL
jgi:hypothetical protein